MPKTTIVRTSFSMSPETYRQLGDLCEVYGENKSHTMSRCIQMIHSALRSTVPSSTKEEVKNEIFNNI